MAPDNITGTGLLRELRHNAFKAFPRKCCNTDARMISKHKILASVGAVLLRTTRSLSALLTLNCAFGSVVRSKRPTPFAL
jgi:hypothetical protein